MDDQISDRSLKAVQNKAAQMDSFGAFHIYCQLQYISEFPETTRYMSSRSSKKWDALTEQEQQDWEEKVNSSKAFKESLLLLLNNKKKQIKENKKRESVDQEQQENEIEHEHEEKVKKPVITKKIVQKEPELAKPYEQPVSQKAMNYQQDDMKFIQMIDDQLSAEQEVTPKQEKQNDVSAVKEQIEKLNMQSQAVMESLKDDLLNEFQNTINTDKKQSEINATIPPQQQPIPVVQEAVTKAQVAPKRVRQVKQKTYATPIEPPTVTPVVAEPMPAVKEVVIQEVAPKRVRQVKQKTQATPIKPPTVTPVVAAVKSSKPPPILKGITFTVLTSWGVLFALEKQKMLPEEISNGVAPFFKMQSDFFNTQ